MIIQSIFPHPLVGRVENVLSRQIEGSLEKEHAGHDGDGVGGGALEDEVVKRLHLGFSLVIFRRKSFGFNELCVFSGTFLRRQKTLKLNFCFPLKTCLLSSRINARCIKSHLS